MFSTIEKPTIVRPLFRRNCRKPIDNTNDDGVYDGNSRNHSLDWAVPNNGITGTGEFVLPLNKILDISPRNTNTPTISGGVHPPMI